MINYLRQQVQWKVLILLVFAGFFAVGQTVTNKNIYIAKDSLSFMFTEDWKFFPGDDSSMASKNYDDSEWKPVKSILNNDKLDEYNFNGIGWFRIYFIADSSIAHRPMALSMRHLGASEIYLDGKRIKSYGEIHDSAHCIYFDPHEQTFITMFDDTGKHVFAVRYANYNARKNASRYRTTSAGFVLQMGETESFLATNYYRNMTVSVVSICLTGIFFVLCFLHLVLFLFYTVTRSNLYFSILMLCLSLLCLFSFINFFSHNPSLELNTQYITNAVFCTMFFSLSLFINELFSKKRGIRFWIMLALYVISISLRFIGIKLFAIATIIFIISVSWEAVITIIFAIIKKVRGARIIGTGILFFSLFLITMFTIALFSGGNFDVNDSTRSGKIIILIAALAILSIPVSMSVYLAWSFANLNKSLTLQLEQVQDLSQKNIEHEQEKVKMITGQNEMLEQKVEERTLELKKEKKKSDDLLLNILPGEVADELKQKGTSEAKLYDNVTVLFTDFVNFTGISASLSPTALVNEIDLCFKAIDEIVGRNGLEKIKTIGDAYLAVCGLPNASEEHAEKTVKAAQEILEYIKERKAKGGIFEIRIGINTGPVVAGIVGIKKFAYDIWGDTVNLANRMESNSEPGKINISGSTYELVKDKFTFIHRGKINVKNKGEMDMYFVNRSPSEG